MNLNLRLFFLIQKLKKSHSFLNPFMIFGAEAVIYLCGIFVTILAFTKQGAYKEAFALSATSIPLSLILILIIHVFIKEQRPFIKFNLKPLVSFYRNLSFPSTHTTIMAIIALPQLYYRTDLGILFAFMLLWLALSRIYIGVHYPIDILGGFFTGIISLILGFFLK